MTATLPSVVGGVPLRLRSLDLAVNRHDFAFNPTDCAPLASESTLISTFGAAQSLSSPFQVAGCDALAFKPRLGVVTGGRPTKARGASIEVKIAQGAQEANLREVQLQLPVGFVASEHLAESVPGGEFEKWAAPGSCAAWRASAA